MKFIKHIVIILVLALIVQETKAQCTFVVSTSINSTSANRFNFVVNTTSATGPIWYKWYFGDGDSSYSQLNSINHNYPIKGNYTATLIVKDGLGCSDTTYHPIQVNQCDYGFNYLITQNGLDTRFDFLNYSVVKFLSFGDGDTLKRIWPNHIHTYSSAGTYNLKMIIEMGACKDTILDTIQVTSVPQCVVSQRYVDSLSNDTYCVYSNFPSTRTDDDWMWYYVVDTNLGSLQMTGSPITNSGGGIGCLKPSRPGDFETCVVRSKYIKNSSNSFGSIYCGDWNCKVTSLNFCRSQANFDATTIGNTGYFKGFMNRDSTTSSYSWNFGSGATSALQNPTHTFPGVGNYPVTLIVTDTSGCTDTLVKTINVCNSPLANFTINQTRNIIVVRDSLFQPAPSGSSYLWDFGDGNTGFGNIETNTYTNPGTYRVLLELKSGNCYDSISKAVSAPPNSSCPWAAYYSQFITGLTVNFTNGSTGTTPTTNYLWSFGDGNQSTATSPTHTYSSAGSYTVSLIITDSSGGTWCSDTISNTLTLSLPSLPCTISSSFTETITGLSVSFQSTVSGTSGPVTYSWDFGDGSNSNNPNPIHTYSSQGIYSVTLNISDSICSDTNTRIIGVTSNVFTPNGDGIDDVFPIPCSGGVANVYNRSGILVKTLPAGTISWDGTNNLLGLEPTGLYFILCSSSSTPVSVTLIR